MTKPCRRRGLSTVEYTHVSLFAARFPPASSNNQVKLYTSYNHVLIPGQVFQIQFFKIIKIYFSLYPVKNLRTTKNWFKIFELSFLQSRMKFAFNSLIVFGNGLYTVSLSNPHRKKSHGLRSGERGGHMFLLINFH